MPCYEYEHLEGECGKGKRFELTQSMKDDPLAVCPECGKPVKRVISAPGISSPVGDSHLKNIGFTKLVKRDKGVYENVTATGKESKFWHADQPGTMPDLKKKISD